jgi:adenylate cyclase
VTTADTLRRVLLGLLTGGAVAGLSLSGPFGLIADRGFDLLSALSPLPATATQDVVIVAIDEPSMEQLGRRWPWSREIHAQLVEELRAAGVKVVGLDILMSEPGPPAQDEALARAIASGPPVLMAADLSVIDTPQARQEILVEPADAFLDAGALVGNAQIMVDRDGVVRRLPLVRGSFSAELAAVTPGGPLPQPPPRALMRYPSPRSMFRTVSFYQALEAGSLLPPGLFSGRIALVGLALQANADPAMADHFSTPRTLTHGRLWPGVEIQATAWANRAHAAWIVPAPAWAEPAMALLAALTIALLPWGGPAAMSLAASLALAIAVTTSLGLLLGASIWLPPLAPGLAGIVAALGRGGLAFARERRDRRFIRDAFARYLAPELVERLEHNHAGLQLGGETRILTIMFCDLRGFTTLSEHLQAEPQRLVRVINGFLGPMTRIVRAHGGTIDKYIGDCIMAFWNAPLDDPDHAAHACRCALAMAEAMPAVNEALATELGALPQLRIGIGLNTGACVVGNVGSELRFAYSVLGDAVNLAARIESQTKEHGVTILAGEATVQAAGEGFDWRETARVAVKGKSQPTTLYALTGCRA